MIRSSSTLFFEGNLMESECKNEIIELHSFFESWFNGELPKSEESFHRFDSVLHTNFQLITPRGEKITQDEIITSIWNAYNSRSQTNPPMQIWIENYSFKPINKNIFVATYEEWQKIETGNQGRLSTVIFIKETNDYNNLSWLHVHETWLP
jgi:hypothetical protein